MNLYQSSEHFLADEIATLNAGRELGRLMQLYPDSLCVFLQGNLGAGKTTLTRGILQAFGHTAAVKSPTYTLVETYQLNGHTLHHFDLYRLKDPEELEFMGIRDYFSGDAICLIEWPEQGKDFLPQADVTLSLTYEGTSRRLSIQSHLIKA